MIEATQVQNKPARYYTGVRAEMLKYIPGDAKRVLDVGCGEGFFGEAVKNATGAEVWGIELFPEAAEKAAGRLDKVFTGDIESGVLASLPAGYFDCVVFNDVLEHLRDPWKALSLIRETLAKGGVVVASIPNVRYFKTLKALLLHKKWEYANAGVLDKTHLRFFTSHSIRDMFEGCGYKITTLEGINQSAPSLKYHLFNILLMNTLNDSRFLQFACVARREDG